MSVQNTINTVFRADTAGYVAAVKHMRGVERDEAKKTLATLEQQNAKLSDQLAVLGKATAAIGAVTIAWKAASSAVSAFLEDQRLEAAAAGASIDKLRDATRGLVETDNLLAFAGRSMHGVWKLNQAEMETVAKGTDVLAKRLGIDLQTAMEGVTEAVTKGTTRSLKDLGIEVKDKEGALKAFADAAREAGKGGDTVGEKWQQAIVILKNAWDDMKGAIGEFVVALAPMVKMISEVVAKAKELADILPDIGPNMLPDSSSLVGGSDARALLARLQAERAAENAKLYSPVTSYGDGQVPHHFFELDRLHWGDDPESKITQRIKELYNAGLTAAGDALAASAERIKKKGGGRGAGGRSPYTGGDPFEALAAFGAAGSAIGAGAIGAYEDFQQAGAELRSNATSVREQNSTTRFQQDMDAIREDWESWYPQMKAELEQLRNQPTILERIFGKPDEIDALVVSIDVARAAVETFGQAGAAAMGAWITGEQTMGEAIKQVLAKSLMALAMESTVKALFHLAAAAGNAAFGNFASAGMHIKAAGMYGAVAVAAGVGAKAAHNAGWAGGGSSGGGAGSAIGGGGRGGSYGGDQAGGERTVVVALGRDFNMLTDLEQRQMLNQAIRIGHADNGGTSHVRFR